MRDAALLALVVAVALGVGRRLLSSVPFAWPLEEGLFAAALGLGLLAYATLGLGLAGLLHWTALGVVLVAGAAYAGRALPAALAGAVRGVGRWCAGGAGGAERAALALAAVVIGAELVLLFAPPVGGDQTKYQLVYPRLYAEAGRIVDTPWSFWGNVQYLVNMLFTAGFVLGGDVLARLVNATFGVLTALALFAVGRRLFSRRVGVWAAILFVTMPLTATLMIRAWVDLALAFYVLLAVLAVVSWREGGARQWLVLGAVMAGLAGGTKVMGLLVPALLAAVVLFHVLRTAGDGRLRRALATAIGFGMIAAVVASPCYLRNAVATGNPIYPFGYGVLGGRNWSAQAARGLDDYYAAYRAAQAARRGAGGSYASWVEKLRFPWDATMAPHSFEEVGRSAYDFGPFVLAFAPGVILLGRDPRVWTLAVVALAYGATVVFGMWAHPRYVHPALPLLLLVAVRVADRLGARSVAWGRAVGCVLIATVVGQTALSARVVAPLWPDSARVAAGSMDAETFLLRHDRRYPLARLINTSVPRDGNVLVLGTIPHPYHLRRRFTLASPLEQGAIDYRRIESVDELVATIGRFGVTHVARETERVEKRAANPIGERVTRLWDGLLARCEMIGETEAGALYRLPPGSADAARRDQT